MFRKFIYQSVRAVRAVKWRFLDFVATLYYRFACGGFGQGSKVGWGTWISNPNRVFIGSDVTLGRECRIFTENVFETLQIEDSVQINDSVLIDFTGGLRIKSAALLSEGAKIYTHSHGRDPRAKAVGYAKTIGSNAWIGADSVVMHSCPCVGDFSIVGVGVVLTSKLTDRQVAVGQPIRVVS